MIRMNRFFVLGLLATTGALFSGCGSDGTLPVSSILVCAKVLHCEDSTYGTLRFVATADGVPLNWESSSVEGAPNHQYFDISTGLDVSPGHEACTPINLMPNGYGYAPNAFRVQALSYSPLLTQGWTMGEELQPTISDVNFGGVMGTGGVAYVTFDCNNPNPEKGSMQAQINKAILKRALKNLKKSKPKVSADAVADGQERKNVRRDLRNDKPASESRTAIVPI